MDRHSTYSTILDLLRFALAMIVVVGHGFGLFLDYFDGLLPRLFPHIQSIAVVCFFYLSGYLIVGSQLRVDKSSSSAFGAYLFDRATRVYVTLIPSIIFVLVADLTLGRLANTAPTIYGENISVEIVLKNILLIPSTPVGTMRPVWSLMYEWWIYLLFGGMFYLKAGGPLATVVMMLGGFFTVAMGVKGEAGHIWLIWFFGGMCAYLLKSGRLSDFSNSFLLSTSLTLFAAAIIVYATSLDAYNLLAGFLISSSMFGLILAGRSIKRDAPALNWCAKNLAGYSFTLFLTHYTVLVHTRDALGLDGWIGMAFGVVASNFVALLIAYFTEFRLVVIKGGLTNLFAKLQSRL